jgi:hypothetical protein
MRQSTSTVRSHPFQQYLSDQWSGATVIIAEGIMALLDPALRDLYDLKAGGFSQLDVWAPAQTTCFRYSCSATLT